MAIKPEHLVIANDMGANPFGNAWGAVRNEDIPAIKAKICYLASEGYSVKDIAMEVQVTYPVIYQWAKQDQDFGREFMETSRQILKNRLEAVVWDQALNGFTDVVTSGGRVVMDPADQTKPLQKTTFDTGQQQFMLKSHDRATYGDKVQTDANLTLRTDRANADLDAAIAKAEAALAADGDEEPAGSGR